MNVPLALVLTLAAATASAAAPREQLKTLTAQLQASPSDDSLRGKIIALAKTLKPAPAIPEEARRAFIQGNTAFKSAKSAADYKRASERYVEACNLAPWWPDAYFNAAKADDVIDNHEQAIRAMKFYMAAATTAAERRQGQDMIYAMEEMDRGAKANAAASASAAAAESERSRVESSIEGTWWPADINSVISPGQKPYTVTRAGSGYAVDWVGSGTPVTVTAATETTIVFTHTEPFMRGDTITIIRNLHREGHFLMGTKTIVGEYSMPSYLVRK